MGSARPAAWHRATQLREVWSRLCGGVRRVLARWKKNSRAQLGDLLPPNTVERQAGAQPQLQGAPVPGAVDLTARGEAAPTSPRRGRVRSSSPALDLWEAQRNLERGDFIEGVLTTMPPGPFIQCQPVGITPSGGHLLGPATGRPLPWL